MEIHEVAVLYRDDLIDWAISTEIEEISILHFKVLAREPTNRYYFVIFIDDDGRTKVIKNKLGDQGLVSK